MMLLRYIMRITPLISNKKGVILIEALIGITILSIALTAYVSALSTTSIAVRKANVRVTAQILARSQLEHTMSQPYIVAPTSYSTITSVASGYSVTSNATAIAGRDDDIQMITVVVNFQGTQVAVLEDFKLSL